MAYYAPIGHVACPTQPAERVVVAEDGQVRLAASVPPGDRLTGRQGQAVDAAAVPDAVAVRGADEEAVEVHVPEVPGGNLPPHVLVPLLAGQREKHHLLP